MGFPSGFKDKDFVMVIISYMFMTLLIIWFLAWLSTPAATPELPPKPLEPVRLCPVDGEVMQWPCKHIPWMGKA